MNNMVCKMNSEQINEFEQNNLKRLFAQGRLPCAKIYELISSQFEYTFAASRFKFYKYDSFVVDWQCNIRRYNAR